MKTTMTVKAATTANDQFAAYENWAHFIYKTALLKNDKLAAVERRVAEITSRYADDANTDCRDAEFAGLWSTFPCVTNELRVWKHYLMGRVTGQMRAELGFVKYEIDEILKEWKEIDEILKEWKVIK